MTVAHSVCPSQVGCSLTCSFCHTGTQKLTRNLTVSDIVGQFLVARDAFGEWPSPNEGRLLSNIVMMGMGEPLLNYDNVSKALKIIMDEEGIKLSKRPHHLIHQRHCAIHPSLRRRFGCQSRIIAARRA